MNDASDNLRGAVLMMLSMVGYVVNDTMMKLVADDLALAQSVFIRGALRRFCWLYMQPISASFLCG